MNRIPYLAALLISLLFTPLVVADHHGKTDMMDESKQKMMDKRDSAMGKAEADVSKAEADVKAEMDKEGQKVDDMLKKGEQNKEELEDKMADKIEKEI